MSISTLWRGRNRINCTQRIKYTLKVDTTYSVSIFKTSYIFFPLKNFVRQKFTAAAIYLEKFPDMQVDNDPIFTSIANIITSEILILVVLCM